MLHGTEPEEGWAVRRKKLPRHTPKHRTVFDCIPVQERQRGKSSGAPLEWGGAETRGKDGASSIAKRRAGQMKYKAGHRANPKTEAGEPTKAVGK